MLDICFISVTIVNYVLSVCVIQFLDRMKKTSFQRGTEAQRGSSQVWVPSEQGNAMFKELWEYQIDFVCVNKYKSTRRRLNCGTARLCALRQLHFICVTGSSTSYSFGLL